MMHAFKKFVRFLLLSIICICACGKAGTPAPTPLTNIKSLHGGNIAYGAVDGAATQAAAMSTILGNVRNTCGEKPHIGKVFQFKGTNIIGVFFSVTNRPQGNTPMAGLVISAASGPHQVEAALVSDNASRFGRTVNSMLRQLLSAWHPAAKRRLPAPRQRRISLRTGSASTANLHTVFAPDNSAGISIADGWQLNPHSGGSTMIMNRPNGELAVWGAVGLAVDPYNPQQVQAVPAGNIPRDENDPLSLPAGSGESLQYLTTSQRAINLPFG